MTGDCIITLLAHSSFCWVEFHMSLSHKYDDCTCNNSFCLPVGSRDVFVWKTHPELIMFTFSSCISSPKLSFYLHFCISEGSICLFNCYSISFMFSRCLLFGAYSGFINRLWNSGKLHFWVIVSVGWSLRTTPSHYHTVVQCNSKLTVRWNVTILPFINL